MRSWGAATVLGLLSGLLLLCGVAGATAQAPDAQPQPLAPVAGAPAPPAAPSAQPPPAPLAPVAAPPVPPAAAVPQPPTAEAAQPPSQGVAPPPAPVEQQALSPLDLFSTGQDTGLGPDIWRGASAELARTIIPGLVDHPLSPAAGALARRLFATAAAAPEGAGSDAELAADRARALLALGDAETAELILDHTPGLANSAALSQTAAEAALIDDHDDKACAIGAALAVGREGAYWLRLRAFCEARAGKTSAQLTATLADQADHDPAFARMLAVIIAGGGDPGAASLRDGVDYAMSRQLKLDLTPALADAPPPIAARLAAADLGAPPPAAPTEANILPGLRAAKTARAYNAAARLALPAIVQLAHASSPLANPVPLAAAALAAGDPTTAQTLRLGLAQAAPSNVDPTDIAILDAALAVAAGKADAATLDRLAERGARETVGPAIPRAQAAAALVLALGWPLDGEARGEVAGFSLGHARTTAAMLLVLEAAADQRLRADVALLSLKLAEAGGEAGLEPADRAIAVRALDRAGLEEDARALALEGLIALEAR